MFINGVWTTTHCSKGCSCRVPDRAIICPKCGAHTIQYRHDGNAQTAVRKLTVVGDKIVIEV